MAEEYRYEFQKGFDIANSTIVDGCLLIRDVENLTVAYLYDLEKNLVKSINPYYSYLQSLNDQLIGLGTRKDFFSIFDKCKNEIVKTITLENYRCRHSSGLSRSHYILFYSNKLSNFVIYSIVDDKVVSKFSIEDFIQFKWSSAYFNDTHLVLYPNQISPRDDQPSFARYDINQEKLEVFEFNVQSTFNLLSIIPNRKFVYYSEAESKVLFVNYNGVIECEAELSSWMHGNSLGYSFVEDEFIILYLDKDNLLMIKTFEIGTTITEKPEKRLDLLGKKICKVGPMKFGKYKNSIYLEGLSLNLDTFELSKEQRFKNIKWNKNLISVYDNGYYLIEDFNQKTGRNNGFTIGYFDDKNHMPQSALSEIPELKELN